MAPAGVSVTVDAFIQRYPKFFILPENQTELLIEIIEEISLSLTIDFDTIAQKFNDSLDEGECRFAV